jgi:chromosomal replication initiation ATPase DnaA
MKNFLYLYGPTGAGKTRLLRVMETTLAEKGANGDVVRVGAEKLVDEMVSELPVQGLDRFFDRYAEVENLLVDNCWVLARKPHAARMLARLFRDRRSGGKLTVVASDLPLGRMTKRLPNSLTGRWSSTFTEFGMAGARGKNDSPHRAGWKNEL